MNLVLLEANNTP